MILLKQPDVLLPNPDGSFDIGVPVHFLFFSENM